MEVGGADLDSVTEVHEQVNVQTAMSYSRAHVNSDGAAEATAYPTGLPQLPTQSNYIYGRPRPELIAFAT